MGVVARLRRKQRTGTDSALSSNVPSPIAEEGRLRVQCWYCGKSVEYSGFDPCAVILVTNWADEGSQREQQFFAHADCFRRSGSGSDLYILEPDFEQS